MSNSSCSDFDPSIHAVRLMTSDGLCCGSEFRALDQCRSDAVGGRIKSCHDDVNASALRLRD